MTHFNINRLFKFKRPRPVIIAQPGGKFQLQGSGSWYRYWRDPYHLVLSIPWLGFSAIIALIYISLNVVFAWIYLVGGDCLLNARPSSFEDAFFFSAQTLSTIGYGSIVPKTTFANSIVLVEAIIGLLVTAIVTGLAFARFTKPNHRIVFSKMAVIAPHNQVPTLMFRLANRRLNHILAAQLKVYLLKDEVTDEGQSVYRIHELPLTQESSPTLFFTWTAMHPIDQNSPLYGATFESLTRDYANIIVSFSGTDNTVAYALNLQHIYAASDILFNYQFENIVQVTANGGRQFDPNYFHRVTPVESRVIEIDQQQGLGLA